MELIRPSSELRNHYNELSKICREEQTPVIITVNGKGHTALLGLEEYQQMKAELELLRNLADAENDVLSGNIDTMEKTFNDLRNELLENSHEL